MHYLKRLLWGLVICGTCTGLYAQSSTVKLYLGKLDNRQARITGPGGVDETFSTKNQYEVVLQHDATYTLEINPEHLVASLEIDLGRTGQIEAVRWQDADGSQTGGTYQTLATTYYALSQPDLLTLFPANLSVDYQQANVGAIYLPEIWLSEMTNSSTDLSLFPGDYELIPGNGSNGVGICYLACEVAAGSGNWASTIDWRVFRPQPGGQSSWQPLDTSYYDLSAPTDLVLVGKELYLDKQIDNVDCYIHSMNYGANGSQSMRFFPGNIDLSIGTGEGLAAYVAAWMDMDLGHVQDTVFWLDPDSSQTAELTVLEPGYVVKSGDTLRLAGLTTQLDLTASDNEILLLQLGDADLGTGYQEWDLFPGNYELKVANTATRLTFEVWPEGRLSSKLRYYDYYDTSIPEDELWKECYALTTDSLRLEGSAIKVDLTAISEDGYVLPQLPSGGPNVVVGGTTTLNLLPSGYYMDITPTGENEAHFRSFLRFGNGPEGLVNPLYWKDLTAGGNPYAPDSIYRPHLVWVTQKQVAIYGRPDAPMTAHEEIYPMLERKPDGEWLHLADRTLRFQYTGRYDAGSLAFRLMNWEREDINVTQSLNLSLNKEHGDNRFALVLPTAVGAGHYLLEVTTEKNETYFLRFEVQ